MFGDKAIAEIMESPVWDYIKAPPREAKKYIEGRGVQIDVSDTSVLADIARLVDIKLRT